MRILDNTIIFDVPVKCGLQTKLGEPFHAENVKNLDLPDGRKVSVSFMMREEVLSSSERKALKRELEIKAYLAANGLKTVKA